MSHIIGTAADFRDFIDILDGFLTDQGHAWGLQYVGDGNGRMVDWAGGVDSVAETFTVTMLDASDFQVIGSVTGSVGYGSVDTPFSAGEIEFTIESGSTAFSAGDAWTISTSPPWEQLRRIEVEDIQSSHGMSGAQSVYALTDGIVKASSNDSYLANSFPVTVEYTLPAPVEVVEYGVGQAGGNPSQSHPTDWEFQYWEASSASWVTLDTIVDEGDWSPTATGSIRSYTVDSPVTADRYRWNFTDSVGGANLQLGQLELRTVSGGINILNEHIVWRAPGNDGQQEIIVGGKLLWRVDNDYYTIELLSMLSWSAAAPIGSQGALQRSLYLPLWNNSMDYWLVADGARVMGAIKLGTQYESFCLGYGINPYLPPNEYPMPLMMGGSLVGPTLGYPGAQAGTAFRYSTNNVTHHAWPMPDRQSSSQSLLNAYASQLRYRDIDGEWNGAAATSADIYAVGPGNGVGPPHSGVLDPQSAGMGQIGLGLNGEPLTWPSVLRSRNGEVLGELKGVRVVPGVDISAETLIRDGAIDWICVPDINRVGRTNYYAMALD